MLGSLTQVRGVRGGATVRFGEVCVSQFFWRRESSARFRTRAIRDAELLGHVAMLEK
jgi:hypothetical protein